MQPIIRKIIAHQSSKLILIFGIQGVSAVLGFALHFVLAKKLAINEYGEFGILFNTVTILSLIVTFGSSNNMLRYISIYHKNKSRCSKELQTSLLFILFNWIFLSTLIILVNQFIPSDKEYYFTIDVILLSLVWVLFTAFSQLFQNFDRAIGFILRSMLPNSIFKSILCMGLIYLFSSLFTELETFHAVLAYVISFILIFMLYLFYERKYLSFQGLWTKSALRYRLFFKSSFQYFINTVSQTLLNNLDLIVIGIFLTSYDAGIYGVATRINLIVIFGLSSLNILYSPQVAKLFKENKINELNDNLKIANRIIFIFSFSLFLIIVFAGESILNFFGEGYTSGFWVLVILSLRNLIEAFFGITGSVLNMSGNQKYFNYILYIILGLYVILSPFAIQLGDLEGLAIFVACIALLKNLVQWKFIYFTLGIRSGLFSNIYYNLISK